MIVEMLLKQKSYFVQWFVNQLSERHVEKFMLMLMNYRSFVIATVSLLRSGMCEWFEFDVFIQSYWTRTFFSNLVSNSLISKCKQTIYSLCYFPKLFYFSVFFWGWGCSLKVKNFASKYIYSFIWCIIHFIFYI